MTKEQILEALHAFVRQRAGLEFGNYGDVRAYRQEQRAITRDRHHAEMLLGAVAWRSIRADDLVRAAQSAYSGRLTIEPHNTGVRIDYTTGQYFPTEYRKAVAAVCASALWDWRRDDKPAPTGDDIRAWACREFGRAIADRYF